MKSVVLTSLSVVIILSSSNLYCQDDDLYPKSINSINLEEVLDYSFLRNSQGQIEFTEIVEVPDLMKDEIYTRVRIWFSENFQSAEHVLDLDDRNSGVLIGTGYSDVYRELLGTRIAQKFYYRIKVEIKDEKYRYSISNHYFENYATIHVPTVSRLTLEEVVAKERKRNGKPWPFYLEFKAEAISVFENLKKELRIIHKSDGGSSDW